MFELGIGIKMSVHAILYSIVGIKMILISCAILPRLCVNVMCMLYITDNQFIIH